MANKGCQQQVVMCPLVLRVQPVVRRAVVQRFKHHCREAHLWNHNGSLSESLVNPVNAIGMNYSTPGIQLPKFLKSYAQLATIGGITSQKIASVDALNTLPC